LHGLPQQARSLCRYRADSSDISGRRLTVTGRHISGARARAAIDGGTMVPDMTSGPVSEAARLPLASAGEAVASAATVKANAADRIAFILAPTSSSSAARQPFRWVDIR